MASLHSPEANRRARPSLCQDHRVNTFPAENTPPAVEIVVFLGDHQAAAALALGVLWAAAQELAYAWAPRATASYVILHWEAPSRHNSLGRSGPASERRPDLTGLLPKRSDSRSVRGRASPRRPDHSLGGARCARRSGRLVWRSVPWHPSLCNLRTTGVSLVKSRLDATE